MYKDLKNKLDYLDCLIRRKATGTPGELSAKMGISERAWYRLLEFLRNDLEVPLDYCPKRKTYYYQREGNLTMGWRPLRDDQKGNISGGKGLINRKEYAISAYEVPMPQPSTFFSIFFQH
jgi:hypothetical protein